MTANVSAPIPRAAVTLEVPLSSTTVANPSEPIRRAGADRDGLVLYSRSSATDSVRGTVARDVPSTGSVLASTIVPIARAGVARLGPADDTSSTASTEALAGAFRAVPASGSIVGKSTVACPRAGVARATPAISTIVAMVAAPTVRAGLALDVPASANSSPARVPIALARVALLGPATETSSIALAFARAGVADATPTTG